MIIVVIVGIPAAITLALLVIVAAGIHAEERTLGLSPLPPALAARHTLRSRAASAAPARGPPALPLMPRPDRSRRPDQRDRHLPPDNQLSQAIHARW